MSRRTLAIALAIAVHVLFLAVLVFSLRWQNRKPEAVTAELYAPPTKSQAAETRSPRSPPPKPTPKPPPEPPRPAPKPEPAVERPDVRAAEIALEAKRVEEQHKREAAERERVKKETEKRDAQKKEAEKKEAQKREQLAAEQKKQEEDARRLAASRERQAREADALKAQAERERQAQAEAAQRAAQAQATARARDALSRAEADYIQSIRQKVRGYVVLPPEMAGNPEAIFEVVQLPTGDIIEATLKKSSGVRAYDDAVQRAIIKSSPLPHPERPDLFQRVLTLKFRPKD